MLRELQAAKQHVKQKYGVCHPQWMQACCFVLLLCVMSGGPAGVPTDMYRGLFMQIQSVKVLLPWEKQLLMKPPHAFGSHLG